MFRTPGCGPVGTCVLAATGNIHRRWHSGVPHMSHGDKLYVGSGAFD